MEEAARGALIETWYSLQQSTVDLASKDITASRSMSQYPYPLTDLNGLDRSQQLFAPESLCFPRYQETTK